MLLPHACSWNVISDDVCIVVRYDKLLILVHEQREKRHKLELELEHLINKRKTLEDDWARLPSSTLSTEAVQEKLKQIRANPPDNVILRQIYDANKAVMSHKNEVHEINQQLYSIQRRMAELETARKDLIVRQNEKYEQVSQART